MRSIGELRADVTGPVGVTSSHRLVDIAPVFKTQFPTYDKAKFTLYATCRHSDICEVSHRATVVEKQNTVKVYRKGEHNHPVIDSPAYAGRKIVQWASDCANLNRAAAGAIREKAQQSEGVALAKIQDKAKYDKRKSRLPNAPRSRREWGIFVESTTSPR